MNRPIYMDYHATTPCDPRVIDVMVPFFGDRFGNPASRNHAFGWEAEKAVEHARRQVADLIGATSKEVIFTSGATESNNLAIKGVARRSRDKGDHIITAATEHKSVLDSCHRLEGEGFRVTYLPVRPDGLIDLEALRRAITPRTILISIMAANNEIGVLQPIAEIGSLANEHDVLFHTDAAQAAAKVRFDVSSTQVDLVSFTAHKLYGPKGIAALYVRRRMPRIELEALIDGGGHERGLRSGTLNVPAIVGFGQAAQIGREEMAVDAERLRTFRDRLLDRLRAGLGEIHINGSMAARLPHNLNVSFPHVEGEALLMGIGDIAVSAGSACSSESVQPSHVLRAIGTPDDLAHSSVRFGLGRFTTEAEVEYVIDKFTKVVTRLREMSPMHGQP